MLINRDIRNMSLEEIAEISKPYVENMKSTLMEKISDNMKLQKQYMESPNREEFLAKAEEMGEVYFVVNFESCKMKKNFCTTKYPNVRVYVGMREEVPIISLQV